MNREYVIKELKKVIANNQPVGYVPQFIKELKRIKP